jgi:hypothetical protein
MANRMPAFVAKVLYPEYWGIGVVAGFAPLLVPAPFGYIVGGFVGIAMVFGLALLDRVDGRGLDDPEEPGPRPTPTGFRKPVLGRRVRVAFGRAVARNTF